MKTRFSHLSKMQRAFILSLVFGNLAFVILFFSVRYYQEHRFSTERWQQAAVLNNSDRCLMLDDLTHNYLKPGTHAQKVRQLLGKPWIRSADLVTYFVEEPHPSIYGTYKNSNVPKVKEVAYAYDYTLGYAPERGGFSFQIDPYVLIIIFDKQDRLIYLQVVES